MQSYIDSAPNTNYINFFNKIKDFNVIPEHEWNKNHVLGYFVYKYQIHYKKNFVFKYNNTSPSKCFEIFQINKLGIHLSQDGSILKKYIDWYFDAKIGNKKITSVSAILNEGIIAEFKYRFLSNILNDTIKRSDTLPMNLYKIISGFNPMIKTYGDLAFLYSSKKDLPIFEELGKVFQLDNLKKVV